MVVWVQEWIGGLDYKETQEILRAHGNVLCFDCSVGHMGI